MEVQLIANQDVTETDTHLKPRRTRSSKKPLMRLALVTGSWLDCVRQPKKMWKVLEEAEVKRCARKECPKSDEGQKQRQKTRLRKLRNGAFKASNEDDVIMDDEKYFTVDGSDTNYNNFYYTHPSLEVPENVMLKKSKFPAKVMIWMAISVKGMSNIFVVKSGNAVNGSVYKDKCLPKLKKFINKYHSDGKYVFWRDLAPSHYAKSVQEAYDSLGIKYLPEDANPPNVPQLRLLRAIETFWAIFSRKVYAGRPPCKSVKE